MDTHLPKSGGLGPKDPHRIAESKLSQWVRSEPGRKTQFLVHFELKSKNLVIINYNKFGHYDQHANFIFRLSGLKGRGHDPRGGATVLKVGGAILRAERAQKIFDPPTFWPVGGGQNYCLDS